jgi:hypothetical protein
MGALEQQLNDIVLRSLVLAYDAAWERGQPGSPEFRAGAVDCLQKRLERVWTLPADPDEWLRQNEARCYELLLDEPETIERILLRLAQRDRMRARARSRR